MNLQCEDGFLFHLWGSTGNCLRCGVTCGIDLDPFPSHRSDSVHLDQGKVADERSVDDPSEFAVLSPAHLVDHPHLREDDLLPSAADGSFVASLGGSRTFPRLRTFLRRR